MSAFDARKKRKLIHCIMIISNYEEHHDHFGAIKYSIQSWKAKKISKVRLTLKETQKAIIRVVQGLSHFC